jgi:nucleoside-triphosphatase THEP1
MKKNVLSIELAGSVGSGKSFFIAKMIEMFSKEGFKCNLKYKDEVGSKSKLLKRCKLDYSKAKKILLEKTKEINFYCKQTNRTPLEK